MFCSYWNNFTMGIEDASYAINEFIKPTISVPIHYNTFPLIEQDPEQFKDAVQVGKCKFSIQENQWNFNYLSK